jgi:protein TonB
MMMDAALIYRSRGRSLIWMAFGCAIAIHLTAVVLAENRSRFVPPGLPSGNEVIGFIDPPPQPSEQPETVSPPEQVPVVTDDDAFPEENATPPPIRPPKKTPMTPIVRPKGAGTASAMQSGSAKAAAMYAPRPAYPYEARRERITGSGIAELTVNPGTGNVIAARMAQSTGSVILDNATLEALRRWRFKPGMAPNIRVPITYTLTGVSY